MLLIHCGIIKTRLITITYTEKRLYILINLSFSENTKVSVIFSVLRLRIVRFGVILQH